MLDQSPGLLVLQTHCRAEPDYITHPILSHSNSQSSNPQNGLKTLQNSIENMSTNNCVPFFVS